MIRVVVADDQALIRAGLRGILEGEADVEVVAEAADGREAVEAARRTGADVVLMDLRMPGVDGIDATRLIRADAALAHVRVLVLTTFETDDYVDRALTAGADGFLGKGAEPRELVDAVRVVAQGGSSLSSRAARGLIDRLRASAPPSRGADDTAARALVARLTDRERDVLRRVASGASNEEIAAALVLSPLTVKTHVNRAMTKVGAHDRAQLVVLAYEAGLLPLQ
ncbi:response regulator transcription factor [Cellulomonas sp. P24]|uniref:response regulator transcription factor n=1 Tax=Cellulomonas sp. P24 TaxID=2885206 RepID=UPI00216B4113|nr:response regulator transcription factor [Cellulomonas sp. P24]